MRLVVFGIGKYYRNREHYFMNSEANIIAYIDNSIDKQGTYINNIPVYSPESLENLVYDYVIIMSSFVDEMKDQLISLNVPSEKIVVWGSKIQKYLQKNQREEIFCYNKKRDRNILFITTDMDYNGGSLVAVYAAVALQNRGYNVVLASPSVTEMFLIELKSKGINVTIWKSLPYIYDEDYDYISQFDMVFVNVFQMINSAFEISKIKPVVWLIHENDNKYCTIYNDIQKEFNDLDDKEWMRKLSVIGVSNIAKDVFNNYYKDIIKETMPFGIPDIEKKRESTVNNIVIAVAACIEENKGQAILLEAYKKMPQELKEKCELWFIGYIPNKSYSDEVQYLAMSERNVRFIGKKNLEVIYDLFSDVDILVCPSLGETMSMSIIEGLMFGKICITSDNTGVAEFITDGVDGYICQSGNVEELSDRLIWTINNIKDLEEIKINARKLYEKYFSMGVFEKRLEKIVLDTLDEEA